MNPEVEKSNKWYWWTVIEVVDPYHMAQKEKKRGSKDVDYANDYSMFVATNISIPHKNRIIKVLCQK